MIRYSNPSTPIELLGSIAKDYRELQDLREQVREAEAAAKRASLSGKSVHSVARAVSRKCVTRRPRRPRDFSKTELRAMLAEAVRNTG
jgi:hypothetical protein